MATTFLEPGGDADFLVGTTNGFWTTVAGAVNVATDFVHGGHIKSIKYPTTGGYIRTLAGTLTDAGTRISLYVYLNALPSSGDNSFLIGYTSGGSAYVWALKISSTGVLRLWDGNGGTNLQIGTDGATLSVGQWYRISLAYTITSTSVNRFELFVNGISSISITNATLTRVGSSFLELGNITGNGLDMRSSDHYIDNDSSLADTGNIWVTAKRPFANGTTNGFTTQIGAGGSGYGSGHSPQVNERPLSTTNGWSMIGAGSAVTEEYNVEAKNVGDIDISTATIVDWLGWISASSLVGETGNIILGGSSVAQAITSTATVYTSIKGSSTYPAGSGTDIGFQTTTALTTVSLYECGVLVAYIPGMASPLLTGIISYYKLDETSGTTAYDSVNYPSGNNGEETAITQSSANGKLPTGSPIGAGFDGTSSKIVGSNINIAANSTISCWVKTSQNSADYPWFYGFGSATASPSHAFCTTPTGFQAFLVDSSDNSVYVASLANKSDGNWHFLVATVTNTSGTNYTIEFFIDNVSQGTMSASLPGNFNSAGMIMGSRADRATYFVGSVDECAYWDRVLTSGEVTQLWNGGAGLAYPFIQGNMFLLF